MIFQNEENSPVNNFWSIINFIRIANQSLVHGFAGSGKRWHYKNTWWYVNLTRHKLFGDEIHAVSQRSDQADWRVPVEGCQFVLRQATVNIPVDKIINIYRVWLDSKLTLWVTN